MTRPGRPRLQSGSQRRTVQDQLKKIESHLDAMEQTAGLITAGRQMRVIVDARTEKNFSFDALRVLERLDPEVDQSDWEEKKLDEETEVLVKYAAPYYKKRSWKWDEKSFREVVGRFTADGRRHGDYSAYWSAQLSTQPRLGTFALAVANIVASEAIVERHYRKQKSLFCKARNRMLEDTVSAEMNVVLNYVPFFGDVAAKKNYLKKAGARQRAAKRKRDRDEELFRKVARTINERYQHINRRQAV
eukprot:Hpha_TRINITY_DN7561_c0_g1::TRINITY_DN7561_c0_g1_i2::g.19087::m.19087